MEMVPGPVPSGQREDQGGERQDAVSTSISADRRSSTSTMPKGAGQLPSR